MLVQTKRDEALYILALLNRMSPETKTKIFYMIEGAALVSDMPNVQNDVHEDLEFGDAHEQ